MGVATYRPRAAEGTVLHRVVRENLETFLREAADRSDGGGLPRFVEREFREFLTCGALGRGFARVRFAMTSSMGSGRSGAEARWAWPATRRVRR